MSSPCQAWHPTHDVCCTSTVTEQMHPMHHARLLATGETVVWPNEGYVPPAPASSEQDKQSRKQELRSMAIATYQSARAAAAPGFGGETYEPERDGERLGRQLLRVKALMLDGEWRTLAEIGEHVGAPEASVSARLRDLRKPKFGGYVVNKRVRGEPRSGLHEYRLGSGQEITPAALSDTL